MTYSKDLGISAMTIGVDHEGMLLYRDSLKMEVLNKTEEKLEATKDLEKAIDACWQGESRDKFMLAFETSKNKIINDLKAEYNDLDARLNDLEYMYYEQDKNMIID